LVILLRCDRRLRALHSFPTRRSSDLERKEDWTLLVPVLLQRFYYRQLMYVVLFRSVKEAVRGRPVGWRGVEPEKHHVHQLAVIRSEEHTSELQSRGHLVCRLLLEKKK